MSATDDLIERLVVGLTPVPQSTVRNRLGLGVGIGLAVSATAMVVTMGLRPDLTSAITTTSFWIKFAFTGLLASAGAVAVERLAHPDGSAGSAGIVSGAVILAMISLAVGQLLASAPADYRGLIMGSTSSSCPWLIMLLAVPVLTLGLWTMRAMAPTRLTRAGGAVGLLAGAASAFVYAFSCDESALPFVAFWYGLGIAATTFVGAVLGRSALRW